MALSAPSRALRLALFTRQAQLSQSSLRWKSSASKPLQAAATAKPIPARLLGQPDKFRPPSHAAQRSKPRAYPGPPLSEEEKAKQKTKQYPHMMPPKGTWTHYFLTNSAPHLMITLIVLCMVGAAMLYIDFVEDNIYLDQLPPNSLIFSHPIVFLQQCFAVYAAHSERESMRVAALYERKTDDARKRQEFLRENGMDASGLNGFTFWGWRPKESQIDEPGSKMPYKKAVALREKRYQDKVEKARKEAEEAGVPFDPSTVEREPKWFGIY